MLSHLSKHIIYLLLLVGIFFSLGWIDKSKLDKASITHQPELTFAHERIYFLDGGSILWNSFIYEASESRRMEVIQRQDVEVMDGFQGITWKWKYHNLLWILLIVSIVFVYNTMWKLKSE